MGRGGWWSRSKRQARVPGPAVRWARELHMWPRVHRRHQALPRSPRQACMHSDRIVDEVGSRETQGGRAPAELVGGDAKQAWERPWSHLGAAGGWCRVTCVGPKHLWSTQVNGGRMGCKGTRRSWTGAGHPEDSSLLQPKSWEVGGRGNRGQEAGV